MLQPGWKLACCLFRRKPKPMNVLTLRYLITQAIEDFIGTYRLGNGVETPAISVRAAGEGLTPGTTVTGLEVVIVTEPDLTPIRQYINEGALRDWTVFLVAWSDNAELSKAAAELIHAFPGSRAVTIRVPENIGPKNQMRVNITTNPKAPDIDLGTGTGT